MKKNTILITIAAVMGIVGTLFAMSDRYISDATFMEFKEHVMYRFDSQDKKLDLILKQL